MVDEEDALPEGVANAATPEGVQQQKRKARQRQMEQSAVLANLLATPEGRRFYFDIVHKLCGIHQPLTSPTMNDNYTLFREGARQVGLDLQNRALQAAKQQYMVLLAENLHNP